MELLVVIAITAILAGLMLPALAAAKERSRRAACKSTMRNFFMACQMYADDNRGFLPSSADNKGNSQGTYLSDLTYSNMVSYGGDERILYCPNIVFGSEPMRTSFGYRIGYNYLAGNGSDDTPGWTPDKGPDRWYPSRKMTDAGTNVLLADANTWRMASARSTRMVMAVAPHGRAGSILQNSSSFTHNLPGKKAADIGAIGGNILFLDGSVRWKNIDAMMTYRGSSDGTSASFGAW